MPRDQAEYMYQIIEAQRDFLMNVTQQWKVRNTPYMPIYMHAFMITYNLFCFDRIRIIARMPGFPLLSSKSLPSKLTMMIMMRRMRATMGVRTLTLQLMSRIRELSRMLIRFS